MGKIPITALEELVKTNLLLDMNNPTEMFKVGELGLATIVGPADGSEMKFYFANKKSYEEYKLHFINEESDISWEKGYITFHINGKSYEIHIREDTMPKSIEYVKFSKNGYRNRRNELFHR